MLEWHVDAFVREAPARLRRQGEETGAVIREIARLREQALTAFS